VHPVQKPAETSKHAGNRKRNDPPRAYAHLVHHGEEKKKGMPK